MALQNNKATKQKEGIQKAFYSSLLKVNPARLKTKRKNLFIKKRREGKKQDIQCDHWKLHPECSSSYHVTVCIMKEDVAAKNTRGLELGGMRDFYHNEQVTSCQRHIQAFYGSGQNTAMFPNTSQKKKINLITSQTARHWVKAQWIWSRT